MTPLHICKTISHVYVLGFFWENRENTRTSHRKQLENMKQNTETKHYISNYIYQLSIILFVIVQWVKMIHGNLALRQNRSNMSSKSTFTFVCQITCLELSSSHPICPSPLVAFSPRASLSFLARRTYILRDETCGKHTDLDVSAFGYQ